MVFPFVISGTAGQLCFSSVIGVGLVCGVAALSATLRACSTACLSGEECVGVCGKPCGVKVGDTASSSIRVARLILCSRERGEVNSTIDKSNGRSPVRSGRWLVIAAICSDCVRG